MADEYQELASEEEKILTLFRKSEIAEDKWAEAVNVLTQIQNYGYDFDTASVIFSAVCTGLILLSKKRFCYSNSMTTHKHSSKHW